MQTLAIEQQPFPERRTIACERKYPSLMVYLELNKYAVLTDRPIDSSLKRSSAGVEENRSPLIALARMYPAPCSRDQALLDGPDPPRPHAADILASPMTTQ